METAFQKNWVEALSYPAMCLSDEFRILAANQAARDLFDTDLNDTDFVRILRHPEALDLLNRAKTSGVREHIDIVLRFNTARTFEISAARLDGKDGLDPELLFTMLDVSAELDAEKSRSTFVANVSHELRSPLTTLMGVVETLQGPARDDADARETFLTLMSGEIERMSRLVGDLLSLSKMEAKEHVRPTEPVDIPVLIQSVISALSASNPNYPNRIILTHGENISQAPADADEITDVFRNLIENALKYSAPTAPVIVDIQEVGAPNRLIGRQIFVTITDEGDGIDSKHLPRLTERFYRVDKGRSREMGGTGLGLAIAKHSLNRHRAKLSIDSQIGVGTTVTVTLKADT